MVENKRKKHHDKDKYYRLAKEQGLRSRAAFKLTQINRHFRPSLLESCQTGGLNSHGRPTSGGGSGTGVVLDLCAAPGGWTQIVARTCPRSIQIIAVDILPIRPFPGYSNVTTLIGDITTDQCKADIRRTLISKGIDVNSNNSKKSSGGPVDLVLHDGAPNIGAEYGKDAYVQNEMILHAMKVACQHLRYDGTFVTKVYRSKDYSSLQWLFQQLFTTVTTFKPKASRTQSAEIFVICQGYKAPPLKGLDPKLFDPSYIFENIEDATTGGNLSLSSHLLKSKKMNVFDKQWDKPTRQRGGYDTDHYEFATLRHNEPVLDFIYASTKEAINILSRCTGLQFITSTTKKQKKIPKKKDDNANDSDDDNDNDDKDDDAEDGDDVDDMNEMNEFLKNHILTTIEIKESLADLRVLNKGDFKALLNWKMIMQEALHSRKENDNDEANDDDDEDTKMMKKKLLLKLKNKKKKKDQDGEDEDDDNDNDSTALDSDQEEEVIQNEIEQLRQRRVRENKRKAKKERAMLMKRRKRSALSGGMEAILDNEGGFGNGGGMNDGEDQQIFSLSSIKTKKLLERAQEVNLDTMSDQQIFGRDLENHDPNQDDIVIVGRSPHDEFDDDDDDDDDEGHDDDDNDEDDDEDDPNGTSTVTKNARLLLRQREKELNEAYDTYLRTTKDGNAISGTKLAKKSKKIKRQQVLNELNEDQEMVLNSNAGIAYDANAYAQLLQHGKITDGTRNKNDSSDDDDDDDDDEDDDGFRDEPMTPAEYEESKKNKKTKKNNDIEEPNPLIHQFPDDEPTSAKTSRWFSNPLFATINQAVTAERKPTTKRNDRVITDDDNDSTNESGTEHEDDDSDKGGNKKKKNDGNKLSALDVLAMMPKTDKQKRHEKRLKQIEKDKWKQEKRAKKNAAGGGGLGGGEGSGEVEDLEIIATDYHINDDENNNINLEGMSEERKKKILAARELIKAGMGTNQTNSNDTDGPIEIVSNAVKRNRALDRERPIPVVDQRGYDSDQEEYDSDDYAETLAIGTMLIRGKSKEKAFLDASYNRYAWNDPNELPDWFVDDEKKHYRPQLPIPPALVMKMKEQMLALSMKPIKKVAEARARKKKRAQTKLVAAKKKAEMVAQSNDLSEAMKLKAISKALQQGRSNSTVGKSKNKIVVAKKGRQVKGAKNTTVVDKRLKCDTRAMKRNEKKKKGTLKKNRRR